MQRLGGEQPIRVRVRVISATNRQLDKLIADGTFREDLHYRLNVVPVRIPALRKRSEDVRALATYFLKEFCARNNFRPKEIDEEVLPILERHGWPGNVRELRNTIERMAILTTGNRITVESLPVEIRLSPSSLTAGLQETRDAAERDRIAQVLGQTGGNVSGAARLLGIERTNLHKRIRALGLSREK